MISRLRGKAVAWDADCLVLEVNGVGYRLFATPAAAKRADGVDEVVLEDERRIDEEEAGHRDATVAAPSPAGGARATAARSSSGGRAAP